MLVPISVPTSAQTVRFPLYLARQLLTLPQTEHLQQVPWAVPSSSVFPSPHDAAPRDADVRVVSVQSQRWWLPAQVLCRQQRVLEFFFLSTHLQGCGIIVTSDGLAVTLSADNVEARQVQWERRCWSSKDAVTFKSHQSAKSLYLPNKHELRLSYCKSIDSFLVINYEDFIF